MAVFDATFLVYLFDTDANPPIDPASGKPVEKMQERIEFLITELEQSGDRVVIPTPSLSEYLVRANEAGVKRLAEIQKSAKFRVVEFGPMAAVELAALTREAIDAGDKKAGVDAPWQKIKLDRQIVAIAKAVGEKAIYSGDPKLHKFAKQAGLEAYGIHDLKIPPEDPQQKLDLGSTE